MVGYLLKMDPVLLILGTVGIAFAALRRDLTILLWSVPFLVFLTAINYVALLHFIPLIPVFCIAAATLIIEVQKWLVSKGKKKEEIQLSLTNYIDNRNDSGGSQIRRDEDTVQEKNELKYRSDRDLRKHRNNAYPSILLTLIVGGIGTYGLAVTTSFILENATSSYFDLYNHIIKELHDSDSGNNGINEVVIIAPEWFRDYYWIPKYVFNNEVDFRTIGKTPKDIKFILIADSSVTDILESPENKRYLQVHQLFKSSKPLGTYNDQLVKLLPYPEELSSKDKREIVGDYGGMIEVRTN